MKLACVIHRFGTDIAGGSESHCRAVAEQLASSHDVDVLTTCAKDYMTWQNEYPAGASRIGPLRVLRFPVARTRSLQRFREISEIVFSGGSSPAEQEQWFRENGPEAPELIEYLRAHNSGYDRILFWSYRYYPTFVGLPLAPGRAVLVPTAENDPLIRLNILDRFFALPAGFLFLTPEEESLVARCCRQPLAPSCVVGSGLEPAGPSPDVPLEPLGIRKPFVLYLGRIDPNKGCETLLRFFVRHQALTGGTVQLVMAGPANMPIPDHPQVARLGFVDQPLRGALLSNASVLMVPSPFESLSLVLLEAWNHGVPALVNGGCDVLKGQALRANGALYYRHFDEFASCLGYLLGRPDIARQLGQQGLAYVNREYRWPVVMQRIEQLLIRTLG